MWQEFLKFIEQSLAPLLHLLAPALGVGQSTLGEMNTTSLLALAAALGWASGIRLYLVVFLVGAAGFMGWLPLPSGLSVLKHPLLLSASFGLLFVEFFANKIPGIDSVWDVLHSVIRVPAGAALAGGVFGADNATMGAFAALMGGSLAATSFATKATTRLAVNTSPEPFSNLFVSLMEDGLVMGVMWLSTNHPLLFAGVLCIILTLSALLLWVLFKFLKSLLHNVRLFLGGRNLALPPSDYSLK